MYVLYVRYVRSSRILRSLRSTSYNLGYHSSSYSSIGSILDRAYINQLASSNSSPSSYNIVLKASVTPKAFYSRLNKLLALINRAKRYYIAGEDTANLNARVVAT
jgi:hypothetical protein